MIDTVPQSEAINGHATIQDPTGLHARPAVRLTKLAKSFESNIELRPEKQETWVNAKSPNAVMKSRAACGEALYFQAQGADARAAIDALIELVNSNFK